MITSEIFKKMINSQQISDILQEYRKLLNSIGNTFKKHMEEHPEDLACSKGCCDCCKGSFEISLLDALLVMDATTKLHPDSETIEKAKLFSNSLSKSGWNFPHFYYQIEDVEDQIDNTSLESTPCPLLDKNGLCKIYRNRPSICRFQGIKIEDPKTGIILEDECPNMSHDRKVVHFNLLKYDQTELDIFAKLCDVIPDFKSYELSSWDTVISSALLWNRK